jgi:hypothetical protein
VGDTTIYVEAQEPETYGSEETSVRRTVEEVEQAFAQAQETIRSVSSAIAHTITSLHDAVKPKEFTLEFGVTFQVDGTVMVASMSSAAALKITMTYNSDSVASAT